MNAADFQNINLYQWIITSFYFLCPSNRLLFISFLLYIFSIFCTFMGFFHFRHFQAGFFSVICPRWDIPSRQPWEKLIWVWVRGIFWTGLYLRWSLSQYHSTREARRVSLWIVINHSDAAWRLSAAARSNFNLPLTTEEEVQFMSAFVLIDSVPPDNKTRGLSQSYIDCRLCRLLVKNSISRTFNIAIINNCRSGISCPHRSTR